MEECYQVSCNIYLLTFNVIVFGLAWYPLHSQHQAKIISFGLVTTTFRKKAKSHLNLIDVQ